MLYPGGSTNTHEALKTCFESNEMWNYPKLFENSKPFIQEVNF